MSDIVAAPSVDVQGGLSDMLRAFLLFLPKALLFVLILPSDATRDIPSRYGHRHAGLEYSSIYPRIAGK